MENHLALDENNNNMSAIFMSATTLQSHTMKQDLTENSAQQQQRQLQLQFQQQQLQFGQQQVVMATSSASSSNSSISSASSGASSTSSSVSLDGITSIEGSDNKGSLVNVITTTTTINGTPLATIDPSTTTTALSTSTIVGQGSALAYGASNGGGTSQTNGIIVLNANGQPAKPRGRRKKIRTEPIRPICPQCEKQFSNQSALTKHKLTHSDERKFTCQQCSKAFKRQDHLTGHMQTHSNRKPFNCTVQGCDKTYCDARSLRRHKENIHHIVTPKENGGPNNHQQQQPQQLQKQQQSVIKLEGQQQQHHHNNNNSNNHHHHQHHHHHSHQQQQINGHNQEQQTQQQQHQNYHQQAPYSADYASTQHFSFDFNHMTHMEQPSVNGSSNTIPRSADSITDSGLGLNVQYEQQMTPSNHNNSTSNAAGVTNQPQHNHHSQPQHQATPTPTNANTNIANNSGYLTPTSLPPPTPNNGLVSSSHFTSEQQIYRQPQQPVVSPASFVVNSANQQPSYLLTRRIQRLHSDGSSYNSGNQTSRLALINSRQQSLGLNQQQQQQQHYQPASYSADYASTQHFSFDFNHMAHIEQPSLNGSSNTIPHSADCITDSGLGLNVQYEQQMTPSNHNNPTSNTTSTTNQPQHHHSQQHQHQTAPTPTITNITNNGGYLTPTSLPPPTPNNGLVSSSQFTSEQQIYRQPQQPVVSPASFVVNSANQQPSYLLTRRIQRLHSDGSSYNSDGQTGRLDLINRQQSIDLNQQHHQQQHYQQVSYSADYASTQHFSFDCNGGESHENQVHQQLLNTCIDH